MKILLGILMLYTGSLFAGGELESQKFPRRSTQNEYLNPLNQLLIKQLPQKTTPQASKKRRRHSSNSLSSNNSTTVLKKKCNEPQVSNIIKIEISRFKNNRNISSKGLKELLELGYLNTVQEMFFDILDLDGIEIIGLLSRYSYLLGQLRCLHLNLNNIGMQRNIVQPLVSILGNTPKLKILNLDGNMIYSGETLDFNIAIQLTHLTNLDILSLNWNNMGDQGAIALARTIQANKLPNLKTLSLNGNDISDQGANALALAIHNLQDLLILNLGWNDIGDQGATNLAQAIRRLQSFNTLNLNENPISIMYTDSF